MHVATLPPPEAPARTPDDWRTALPEGRRRHLRVWLGAGAGLTFAILVIGGITRLTQSGLSIVDWAPIMGVIPPLSEAQWMEAFDRYREFPEYQLVRRGMSLDEFRFIYFWEYLHRLAARLVGVVFLLPFLYFWAKGYLSRPLVLRLSALFLLGAAQGVMGWYMVMSGLVENPTVSHFRLAAHLTLALAILGGCVWLMRELAVSPDARPSTAPGARGWVAAVGVLLAAQVLWGAFVAGLRAGRIYTTFPLMDGGVVPPGFLSLRPVLANFFENPATVQWTHRLLGTALLLAAVWAAARLRGAGRRVRGAAFAFGGLVTGQYLLGVATLMAAVPVSLGVAHQGVAAGVVAVWVVWAHAVWRADSAG